MSEDLFDGLLELEEKFYGEGYSLGVEDGRRAGLVEGRLFGLEKGFEKYAAMGKLHGRSVVWAGRLPPPPSSRVVNVSRQEASDDQAQDQAPSLLQSELVKDTGEEPGLHQIQNQDSSGEIPLLPDNPRLEKHIRTLYALVEPSSLSTLNNEDSVSHFDDRFRRAEGKVRLIEKLIGEENKDAIGTEAASGGMGRGTGQVPQGGGGGIEDIRALQARH